MLSVVLRSSCELHVRGSRGVGNSRTRATKSSKLIREGGRGGGGWSKSKVSSENSKVDLTGPYTEDVPSSLLQT